MWLREGFEDDGRDVFLKYGLFSVQIGKKFQLYPCFSNQSPENFCFNVRFWEDLVPIPMPQTPLEVDLRRCFCFSATQVLETDFRAF